MPPELPAALAIVNPKLTDSAYGSEPAAVGVAYKVVHDLYDRLGRPYAPEAHRALVALGTICDLAPMVSENRDLVRLGLDALRATTRPGLQALCAIAGTKVEEISVETCGWALGPRLNAAGRMEHARLALDLLLAPTLPEARALAERLDELNRQRREQTTEATEIARVGFAMPDAVPGAIASPGRMTRRRDAGPATTVNCCVDEMRALIAAACPGVASTDLEAGVRSQLRSWWGSEVDAWQHLRTDSIAHGQPDQRPPFTPKQTQALGDGLFVCGDHRDTPSIQGALFSGRRCAAAVLAD